jgi:hypothetical protein
MWCLEYLYKVDAHHNHIPITRFGNTLRMNPGTVRVRETLISAIISFTFICIHLVAWNFTFPTVMERDLSRGACIMLLGCGFSYANLWLLLNWQLSNLCRLFAIPQVRTVTELCEHMHPVLQYALTLAHVGSYGLARLFIIVEGFAGLRALPASSFRGVEWSDLLPHI